MLKRNLKFLFFALLVFVVTAQVNAQSGAMNRLQGMGSRFGGGGGGAGDSLLKRVDDSITISFRYLDSSRAQRFDTVITDFTRFLPVPWQFKNLGNLGNAAESIIYSPKMQSGWDHGNSTKRFGIAVEGRECRPVIGAMRAAVNDDGAIDPQCRMKLHEVFAGAVLGRVAALFAEGKLGPRSKDMNVRVAGTRRHRKGRTFRVAVGAGAGLQCAGLIRAHGSSVTCC